ncbi:MAG: autotransporter-associated beta strand repeat-containing protein [Tepidisphaeraceae bacterium]
MQRARLSVASSSLRSSRSSRFLIALAGSGVALALAQSALATDGTWITGAAGTYNYDDTANWAGGVIADLDPALANFSTVDLNGTVGIDLATARTLTNLTFADTDISTLGTYALTGSGITLAGTTPTITVGALEATQTVTIANTMSGTAGLTKAGAGVLQLTSRHNITGGININAGTLRIDPGHHPRETTVPPSSANIYTISNGAKLTISQNHSWASGNPTGTATNTTYFGLVDSTSTAAPPVYASTASSIWVPAGQSAVVESGLTSGTLAISQVGGGAGSSLTLRIAGGTTVQARGSWATNAPGASNAGGDLGSLRVETVSGNGNFDMARNVSGNRDLFGTNSFQNTAVSLGTGVTAFLRTGSSGNSMPIGSLAGDAGSTLYGGRSSGGSLATYTIGSLNTNTEFAGTITSENNYTAATPNALVGTTNITKVGTGKLTLSGTLSYVPRQYASGSTSTLQTFGVRGGITTVSAGTLALTNTATVPGGDNAANLSTIDVRSGATLDVSGSTVSGGYTAPAFQQIIGPGTIVGPFNLGSAILAPANTMGTSPTAFNTPVAGTMNFTGALTIASGALNFDIGASASDLINVSGPVTVGGTVAFTPNYIGTVTPGNYTIINATSITGDPSAWTPAGPRGGSPTLSIVGGTQLVLNIPSGAAPATLNWSGSASTAWDTSAVTNWYNTGTLAADKFYQSDTVYFKDTSDGVNPPTTTTVALNGTVNPGPVVFDNSAVTYTVSGSGKISGATTLTKSGSGTVNLSTANDYSGGTTLNAGTLNLGSLGSVGTGTITFNGGTLQTNSNTALANAIAANTGTTSTFASNGSTGSNVDMTGAWTGSGAVMFTSDNDARNVTIQGSFTGFTGTLGITSNTRIRLTSTTTTANTAVVIDGGSLAANGSGTTAIGSLAGTGGLLMGYSGGSSAATHTWQIGSLNTSTTFAGVIGNSSGSGSSTAAVTITKVGTGTLTLTGASTYTGTTNVQTGTLQIGNGGTSGNLATNTIINLLGSVASDATIAFNRSDDVTVPNIITGVGTVLKAGAGTTTLSGTNSYAGPTVVTGGTLKLVGIAQDPILNGEGVDLQGGRVAFDYTGGATADGIRLILKDGYDNQTPKFSTGRIRATTMAASRVIGWIDDGVGTITAAVTLPGDATLDGTVNFSDLLALAANYNSTSGIWAMGDFNYDQNVNFTDLLGLAANYNQTVTASFAGDWALAQSMAAPEPTTLVTLASAGLLLSRRRR